MGRPSERSCATRYLGLKPLTNSRNVFIVSARLTVVPQIARISSGSSSVSRAGAERGGTEDAGSGSPSASEERLGLLLERERAAGRGRVGVRLTDEWMSPRLFLGVASPPGLL